VSFGRTDRIAIAITCVSITDARKNDIVAVRFYTTVFLNVYILQCFIFEFMLFCGLGLPLPLVA